jgi:hypothetical protein
MQDPQCINYRIDSDDRIVSISGIWDEFATANQAAELTRDKVLNRSIYDFITGMSARYVTEQLLHGVRENGRPVSIPFRCDAPTLRRFMQMLITPEQGGEVDISSCIVREEPRDAVRLLDRDTDRSQQFVTICSWCKDIEIGEDNWLPVEDAVRVLAFFDEERQPQITHGICPACHRAMLDKLKNPPM